MGVDLALGRVCPLPTKVVLVLSDVNVLLGL